MRYKRKRRKKKKILFLLFTVLIIIAAVLVTADAHMRPIIMQISKQNAQAISTQIINDSVSKVLAEDGGNYQEMVTISKDTDGKITDIQSNIVAVNQLKAAITSAVQSSLLEHKEQEISIPVGTLTGNDFFAGRGPGIPVRIELSSSIISDLSNNFDAAGINQTRHQIMMTIKSNVYIILLGNRTTFEVTTTVCIAETIIVGSIPDAYLNWNGTKSEIDSSSE